MPDITTRRANFDHAIEEYDEKALTKSVDFEKHRYITIERDGYTDNRYAKGHHTLRQACDYLARVQEEGEPFVPEFVLDLDSGELHDLDLLAFVAPRHLDAVAVMMPRPVAHQALSYLRTHTTGGEVAQAAALIEQALKRKH